MFTSFMIFTSREHVLNVRIHFAVRNRHIARISLIDSSSPPFISVQKNYISGSLIIDSLYLLCKRMYFAFANIIYISAIFNF